MKFLNLIYFIMMRNIIERKWELGKGEKFLKKFIRLFLDILWVGIFKMLVIWGEGIFVFRMNIYSVKFRKIGLRRLSLELIRILGKEFLDNLGVLLVYR